MESDLPELVNNPELTDLTELPPLPPDDDLSMGSAEEKKEATVKDKEEEKPAAQPPAQSAARPPPGETKEAPIFQSHSRFMKGLYEMKDSFVSKVKDVALATKAFRKGEPIMSEMPIYFPATKLQSEEIALDQIAAIYFRHSPTRSDYEGLVTYHTNKTKRTREMVEDRLAALNFYCLPSYSIFDNSFLTSGVYLVTASIQRQCNYNATVWFFDKMAVVVANRDIEQGEAIILPWERFQPQYPGRSLRWWGSDLCDCLACQRETERDTIAEYPPLADMAARKFDDALTKWLAMDNESTFFRGRWIAVCLMCGATTAASVALAFLKGRDFTHAPVDTQLLVCVALLLNQVAPPEPMAKIFAQLVTSIGPLFLCNLIAFDQKAGRQLTDLLVQMDSDDELLQQEWNKLSIC